MKGNELERARENSIQEDREITSDLFVELTRRFFFSKFVAEVSTENFVSIESEW